METRPLTQEERRSLEAGASRGRQEGAFAAFFASFLVLGGGLLLAERVLGNTQLSQAVPVILALGVGLIVYHRSGRSEWREKQREAWRGDLEGGVAEVSRYVAKDAIRVEEFEDEGISFFVQLEDGRVLFLSGQYLYEADEDQQFPSTRFTIEHTPRGRLVLGFECEGTYFPPSITRVPFSDAESRDALMPSDGEIVTLDYEDLRTSGGKLRG